MSALVIHPAVRVVLSTVGLWNANPEQADKQARLIVARLIESGFLDGRVQIDMPVVVQRPRVGFAGGPLDDAEGR